MQNIAYVLLNNYNINMFILTKKKEGAFSEIKNAVEESCIVINNANKINAGLSFTDRKTATTILVAILIAFLGTITLMAFPPDPPPPPCPNELFGPPGGVIGYITIGDCTFYYTYWTRQCEGIHEMYIEDIYTSGPLHCQDMLDNQFSSIIDSCIVNIMVDSIWVDSLILCPDPSPTQIKLYKPYCRTIVAVPVNVFGVTVWKVAPCQRIEENTGYCSQGFTYCFEETPQGLTLKITKIGLPGHHEILNCPDWFEIPDDGSGNPLPIIRCIYCGEED